jgi:hypothetical protein
MYVFLIFFLSMIHIYIGIIILCREAVYFTRTKVFVGNLFLTDGNIFILETVAHINNGQWAMDVIV